MLPIRKANAAASVEAGHRNISRGRTIKIQENIMLLDVIPEKLVMNPSQWRQDIHSSQ